MQNTLYSYMVTEFQHYLYAIIGLLVMVCILLFMLYSQHSKTQEILQQLANNLACPDSPSEKTNN